MIFSDDALTRLAKDLTILWSYIPEEQIRIISCFSERCLFIHYKEPDARLFQLVGKLRRQFVDTPERFMPLMMSTYRTSMVLVGLMESLERTSKCKIFKDPRLVRHHLENEPVLQRLNKKIELGTHAVIISVEQSQRNYSIICFKVRPDFIAICALPERQKVICAVDMIQCECLNCCKEYVMRTCSDCQIAKYCSRSCERSHGKFHRSGECDEFKRKHRVISDTS